MDRDNAVTDKTRDGLFELIGQQQQSIRRNPAAPTTVLLQQVFGDK